MARSLKSFMEFRDQGPVTKKIMETDRTIVTLVCLQPGQRIPPFTHRSREAFVHCLEGTVRVTPGDGPAELGAGDVESYDGTRPASPSNPGTENAAFVVTLVRKKDR
ncbi:MAG: cupin domain-containing protein [Planctomycetota bacterium]|jgi:quercetin dioxygenase-like cupin family protein